MLYFIVNPHSKTGKAKAIWAKIEAYIKSLGIAYEAFLTQHLWHAGQIAADLYATHASDVASGDKLTIAVVGGDGTFNEVLSGIGDFSRVILGYVPTGSGNDLARGLSIPRDSYLALHRVLSVICKDEMEQAASRSIAPLASKRALERAESLPQPKVYRMDLGNVDLADSRTGKKAARRFAVSTGIGYDAEICFYALKSKLKVVLNRIGLGKLTYLLIGFVQVLRNKRVNATLILDKKRRIPLKNLWFAAVMIQPYEGGGIKMTPEAKNDDGVLSVCTVSGIGRFAFLRTIPKVFSGKHIQMKGVGIYNCKSLELIANDARIVHTDGECNDAWNHLNVVCSERLLRIIV
jgi:diacylglycerol kinase family enzyme